MVKKNQQLDVMEDFWNYVLRAEQDYHEHGWRGHVSPDHINNGWDEEFAAAYERIKPQLKRCGNPKFHQVPPGLRYQSTPIHAESAHEALMIFLNPPYMLYGDWDVLDSEEYQEIKSAAIKELQDSQEKNAEKKQPKMPRHRKTKLAISALATILREHHFPETGHVNLTLLTQEQIATRLECSQPTINRHMKRLFKTDDAKGAYSNMFLRERPERGFRKEFEDGTVDYDKIVFDELPEEEDGDDNEFGDE